MALLTNRDPLAVGEALARWITESAGGGDLRVVNEIQSRLRENEQAPVNSEDALPQRTPGKEPGSTDGTKPGPRQQNRADGIYRNLEVLADQMPVFAGAYGGRRSR